MPPAAAGSRVHRDRSPLVNAGYLTPEHLPPRYPRPSSPKITVADICLRPNRNPNMNLNPNRHLTLIRKQTALDRGSRSGRPRYLAVSCAVLTLAVDCYDVDSQFPASYGCINN